MLCRRFSLIRIDPSSCSLAPGAGAIGLREANSTESDKGLVRRYLAKVTGLSRAQLTRLIGQHRETGRIEDRRGGAPACPFERRYTRADIRLLAAVDAAMGQMSGPATRALMRRQYEVFDDERFERLAGLSNGHPRSTSSARGDGVWTV